MANMIVLGTLPIIKWLLILINRVASWFGSGYFVKKGLKEKRKRYFVLAIALSLALFLVLLIIARRFEH
jgi:hypothetical protein